MSEEPVDHVANHRANVIKALGLMGVKVADDISDEELVTAFGVAINSPKAKRLSAKKPVKDVFDPSQLSGISCPTDPGTTPISPPAIDPAVAALYAAQGFG